MSANEIAERLQAHAWLSIPPNAGEGYNNADFSALTLRSAVGFQQRIVCAADQEDLALIILPLERMQSRLETCILVNGVMTVDEEFRTYFPSADVPQGLTANFQPGARVQPIQLAWMGSSLATPSWYPFQTAAIPSGNRQGAIASNMDLFDAIAIQPAATDEEGTLIVAPGDLSIAILKVQKQVGEIPVQAIIQAPA